MKEKLGKGMLHTFALIIIGIFATAGLLLSINNTFFGPMTAEAGMTQTQKGINEFINDIMNDKSLTDEQKAMIVQTMRTFTADCITSMDDAKLLIQKLIESDLLNDEEKEFLSSVLAMIESGEITDLGLVKSILSNILLKIKGYVVGEKSPTYMNLEALIENIKADPSLTDRQKGMYSDILYAIMDEDLSLVNLPDAESIKSLIKTLLDNDMITDTTTKATLEKLLSDLEDGKEVNLRVLKEVLRYSFKQMMGDSTYSLDQKNLLDELVRQYTNKYDGVPAFTDIEDAEKFLEKLLDSGLITDAHVIRDSESVLTMIYSGGDVSLDTINDVIARALDNIKANLLAEKISVLTGTEVPEGIDANTYYEQLISRFTSSQFNYLETLALANRSDIDKLMEEIDQNMVLTDEQRQALLDSLETYQRGGDDTLSDAARQLQEAIDKNGRMDSKTKAGLITMINSVDDDNKMSVRDLRDKLQKKIDDLGDNDRELKKDLEKIIANLDASTKQNYENLKKDLKKLEKDENDDIDDVNIAMASIRKDLASSNSSDAAAMASIRTDLTALDRKTASKIEDLANNTDSSVEALKTQVNARMNAMEADTDEKLNDLESETDTKINNLRNETNTAIALLRADLDDVAQSVVDTNEAMTTMNENLIARDEDMKTALGASMLASFTNVETSITNHINNTNANLNAMYVNLNNKIKQVYDDNQAIQTNMGTQFDATLDTSGSEPVLTFTPHDATAVYTATDPGTATEYDDLIETDVPSGTYVEPTYGN